MRPRPRRPRRRPHLSTKVDDVARFGLLEISELPPLDRTWLEQTGACCSYISRVKSGHTVPAVETLEKFARALEVPMYQLFYDGEEPPKLPHLPKRKTPDDIAWGSSGKEARLLVKFCRLLSRMKEGDRGLMLSMAQKMSRTKAG